MQEIAFDGPPILVVHVQTVLKRLERDARTVKQCFSRLCEVQNDGNGW